MDGDGSRAESSFGDATPTQARRVEGWDVYIVRRQLLYRAVSLARHKANLGNLGSVLVEALGGSSTAKVLFSGKITEVNRTMYKGHSVGEVVIQALQVEEEEEEDPSNPKERYEGTLKSKSIDEERRRVKVKKEDLPTHLKMPTTCRRIPSSRPKYTPSFTNVRDECSYPL